MLDIFLSGGWLMYPILLCSIAGLAIVAERLWSLQSKKIVPQDLLPTLLHNLQNKQVDQKYLKRLAQGSPLGSVLAKGVMNMAEGHDMMSLKMAEQGRHVIHDLEKYLNALGTIAAVTPLLGLLGTVMGMIRVFSAITVAGPTNPEALAGGISVALVTTAFGLSVAIPSLMFHRHFQRKIDEIAVTMEQEAAKFSEYYKDLASQNRQSAYEKNIAA